MNNRLKYVSRSILQPKLNKCCRCKGKICARSQVLFSFGMNDGNNERILIKDVKVEEISIDHLWVKSKELNDAKSFNKGVVITFKALVSSYQKMGGRVGIGLHNIQNIEIVN